MKSISRNKYTNLGSYIFRRIQKDNSNPEFNYMKPKEMMTGLYVNAIDISRYINDYFKYGVDYTVDDNMSAEDKLAENVYRFWDDPDGWEG